MGSLSGLRGVLRRANAAREARDPIGRGGA